MVSSHALPPEHRDARQVADRACSFTPGSTPVASDNGGSGGSLVAIAVGTIAAVGVLAFGVVLYNRRRGQQQPLPPLPPQSQIVSMFVNPVHHDLAGGPTADYDEPGTPHHDASPRVAPIEVDSELYVAGPKASAAEASYAVFRSTNPAETDDAQYHVFRDERATRKPDATA